MHNVLAFLHFPLRERDETRPSPTSSPLPLISFSSDGTYGIFATLVGVVPFSRRLDWLLYFGGNTFPAHIRSKIKCAGVDDELTSLFERTRLYNKSTASTKLISNQIDHVASIGSVFLFFFIGNINFKYLIILSKH